jgi:hypothetical protein
VVAEIDEQQIAVITLAVDPARQSRRDFGVLEAKFATGMGAIRMHGHQFSRNVWEAGLVR